MTASKARIKANAKYNQKAYEQIKIQSRKENRLNELIAFAAKKNNISNARYIIQAIEDALKRDNISIADLPVENTSINMDKEEE